MNLVPQNVNEAIKHLTPRSKEEIEHMIANSSDEELFKIWEDTDFNSLEEKQIYKELKKRNSQYLEKMKWFYDEFRYKLKYANESI